MAKTLEEHNHFGIDATIIADSKNEFGQRLTTYVVTFPRIILAEVNTHRMFSRNSASSRAVPFKTMVERVENNPFIPIAWQKDHKGMQGSEYITDEKLINRCKEVWLHAKDNAVERACELHGDNWIEPENKHLLLDVTKQLCNRLLEPFMWHTAIITATEWENFFKLRCPQYYTPVSGEGFFARSWKELQSWHSNPKNEEMLENADVLFKLQHNKGQGEIHIMALAEAMWDAMNESTPKQLKDGEWHIPFSDNINDDEILQKIAEKEEVSHLETAYDIYQYYAIKIATARCARLSYMTFDGEIDYEKDIKLHDTLLESQHMSPFEHCARAMSNEEYNSYIKGKFIVTHSEPEYEDLGYYPKSAKGWCNNFKGFIQYRAIVE